MFWMIAWVTCCMVLDVLAISGDGKIAVLLMNHDKKAQDLVLNFGDIPGINCQKCTVRCLYASRQKMLGEVRYTVLSRLRFTLTISIA